RARYKDLIAEPERIEQVLKSGATRLRAQYAAPFVARLREAVGLRRLDMRPAAKENADARPKMAKPQFKQYREADGLFYFKLVSGDGRLLLQSRGFASPRDAGQAVSAVSGDNFAQWGNLAEGVTPDDLARALELLRAG
ncbi:MAG: tryptophan--tRNA ligase, partial [Azoarcus sp.]|nr:tryptophan--tRNA ligase [Azoarcus sp.]